jgi:hypothetical protein
MKKVRLRDVHYHCVLSSTPRGREGNHDEQYELSRDDL